MTYLDSKRRTCQRLGCRRKSDWLVLGEGRLEDGGLCGPCMRRLSREDIMLRNGQTVKASYLPIKDNVPFAMIRAVAVLDPSGLDSLEAS